MASKGAGRGGRKTISGKRNRVLVYILYNLSDIAENVPGMSSEVREFCTTCKCLKGSLKNQKLRQTRFIVPGGRGVSMLLNFFQ